MNPELKEMMLADLKTAIMMYDFLIYVIAPFALSFVGFSECRWITEQHGQTGKVLKYLLFIGSVILMIMAFWFCYLKLEKYQII